MQTLEKVKKQYQQYLEVSGLYDLLTLIPPEEEEVQYEPPSPERPLTTDHITLKKD